MEVKDKWWRRDGGGEGMEVAVPGLCMTPLHTNPILYFAWVCPCVLSVSAPNSDVSEDSRVLYDHQ